MKSVTLPKRRKTWNLMYLGMILLGIVMLAALLLLVPHGWEARQPYALHSALLADYSAEALPLAFAPVSIDIIPEVLEDESLPGEPLNPENIIIPTVTPRLPGGEFTSTPAPTSPLASTGTLEPTGTLTVTETATITLTPTATNIWTVSATASRTATITPTQTRTPTLAGVPTGTHTPTRTPTRTVTTPPPTATYTLTPQPPTATKTSTEDPYPPPTYVVPTSPTGYP